MGGWNKWGGAGNVVENAMVSYHKLVSKYYYQVHRTKQG